MYKIVVALLMVGVASSVNLRVDRFEQWLEEFRVMIHTNEHRQHLYRNWMENDKYIDESNARNLTYTLGHNHLSGMDSGEFSQYMGFESNKKELSFHIDTDKIKTRIAEVKCLGGCVHKCFLVCVHIYVVSCVCAYTSRVRVSAYILSRVCLHICCLVWVCA